MNQRWIVILGIALTVALATLVALGVRQVDLEALGPGSGRGLDVEAVHLGPQAHEDLRRGPAHPRRRPGHDHPSALVPQYVTHARLALPAP